MNQPLETAEAISEKIIYFKNGNCDEEEVIRAFISLIPLTENDIAVSYRLLNSEKGAVDLLIYFLRMRLNIKARTIADSTGISVDRINKRRHVGLRSFRMINAQHNPIF